MGDVCQISRSFSVNWIEVYHFYFVNSRKHWFLSKLSEKMRNIHPFRSKTRLSRKCPFRVEGRTIPNNSPIDLHVKWPYFNGHFLGSGYIYSIFDTYGSLGNILNFILSFISWGVVRLVFPLRVGEGRPHFFASTDSPKHRFARGIRPRLYFLSKSENS